MGTRLSQEDSKGAELTPRFVACAFGTSVAARNPITEDVLRFAALTVPSLFGLWTAVACRRARYHGCQLRDFCGRDVGLDRWAMIPTLAPDRASW